MNNIEAEQFTRLCNDIGRIADHLTKKDDIESDGIYLMLGASVQGAAVSLREILDSGDSQFTKAGNLRKLVVQWEKVAGEYYQRQSEVDKSKKAKESRGD